ncbi:MAG: 2-hydroxyacyl-CoA dehydratase family protein [Proteobacteria bacterium]|nr:2-hydroxyacyl-CoA dehydratase family protein [Pseudomonadota bacterium]
MIKLTRFIIQNPKLFAQGIKGYMNQHLSPRLYQIILQYLTQTKMTTVQPWKKFGVFSAGFPTEIPLAMGYFPGYPEAYAAFTGAAGCTVPPIEHAESLGYGRDLCSYMKTSIGASRMNWPEDFGGNRPADAYFSANLVCDTHLKWFESEARIHGKPHFALDVPSLVAGESEERLEEYVDYVVQQLYDLIGFLEQHTGRKFNERKFFELVNNSFEISSLFKELNAYRKRFPANRYFEWVRSFMLPMVSQWNQKDAIRYYKKHLEMARKRYGDNQTIASGREKYRVLWEGITLWYNVDLYQKVLADKGAYIVADPYTYSFAARSKPKSTLAETLRQIARDHIIIPFTLNLDRRIAYFNTLIKEFDLDGIIMHANQSCRPNSTGLLDLKEVLHKKWGIPVLMMNTDHCDPRAYADGPMNTRIDGFVEMMEIYKEKRIKI